MTSSPRSPSADLGPLSPTDFASAVTAITSAFGDPTRRDIYLYAHEHPDGVTAGDVAGRFALHANVARHHLDKLTAGGHLEVSVARPPGAAGAGRPSKRYRTHGDAMELDLPVRHDDVLVTLLGRALALIPSAQAEAMAEEVGLEYGRTMAAAMGAHGFAAHAERDGNELRIVADHCPFGDAAVEHPVICAVDRGMVRGMLEALYGDATALTASSRAAGDATCITAVGG